MSHDNGNKENMSPNVTRITCSEISCRRIVTPIEGIFDCFKCNRKNCKFCSLKCRNCGYMLCIKCAMDIVFPRVICPEELCGRENTIYFISPCPEEWFEEIGF